MLLIICAAAILHLVGAAILITVWYRAPRGFEDANQFHFVDPPEPSAGMEPPSVHSLTSAYRGTR